jgi:hypothetical protein
LEVKRFVIKKPFKRDLTYEVWLKNFIKPLSNSELNQMEKEFNNFASVNNSNFQPLQGA